ncbi:hypothetical protein K435DRAFT_795200 [Dendrothele bispora CBS 962.96]|uniref:Uncharacterized protein n=1 Tax=Dendrothele bispora (strain CBS 962.96) TaxID=1314807 RepID=A0A4V4HGI5_DENBC|nr:hypothetical protein K435DRAFT_795200 [Dendrothele bispora CBS 962.96]
MKKPRIPLPVFPPAELDDLSRNEDSLNTVLNETDVDLAPVLRDIDMNNPPPRSESSTPDIHPHFLRSRQPFVEDLPDTGDEEEEFHEIDSALDEEYQINWDAEIDEEGLESLTFEDLIWGDVEKELADYAEELTDDEIGLLRHYTLKVETYMTLETFKALPFAFPDAKIQSWKVTKSRAA